MLCSMFILQKRLEGNRDHAFILSRTQCRVLLQLTINFRIHFNELFAIPYILAHISDNLDLAIAKGYASA